MRRERRSFTCRLRMPWLHEHTSMQPQQMPHTPAVSRNDQSDKLAVGRNEQQRWPAAGGLAVAGW